MGSSRPPSCREKRDNPKGEEAGEERGGVLPGLRGLVRFPGREGWFPGQIRVVGTRDAARRGGRGNQCIPAPAFCACYSPDSHPKPAPHLSVLCSGSLIFLCFDRSPTLDLAPIPRSISFRFLECLASSRTGVVIRGNRRCMTLDFSTRDITSSVSERYRERGTRMYTCIGTCIR